jgi:hypothetical protein
MGDLTRYALTGIAPSNKARDRDENWTSATIAGRERALKYLASSAKLVGR